LQHFSFLLLAFTGKMNASPYEQASAGLVSRMGYRTVEVYPRQDIGERKIARNRELWIHVGQRREY
jgi:hypothetical protein